MTEPVRAYLYPVLLAVVGVLVGYGIIEQTQAALWIALGAALLGVPAVESARSKVTPVE
jgi:hypothetical protein